MNDDRQFPVLLRTVRNTLETIKDPLHYVRSSDSKLPVRPFAVVCPIDTVGLMHAASFNSHNHSLLRQQ